MTTDDVIFKLVLPAATVLAGVIALFWKVISKHHIDTKTKLDMCEEKHEETNTQLLTLTGKVGELEGRQNGIEHMSTAVLEEVRKLGKLS